MPLRSPANALSLSASHRDQQHPPAGCQRADDHLQLARWLHRPSPCLRRSQSSHDRMPSRNVAAARYVAYRFLELVEHIVLLTCARVPRSSETLDKRSDRHFDPTAICIRVAVSCLIPARDEKTSWQQYWHISGSLSVISYLKCHRMRIDTRIRMFAFPTARVLCVTIRSLETDNPGRNPVRVRRNQKTA